MIKKCVEENENEILEYIGENYNKCLYLYLDFIKYGLNNPNVNVYLQKEKECIKSIILTYYTGMHIFARNTDFNISEIVELIKEKNPSMICGEKRTINALEKDLQDYDPEYGWVRELSAIEKVDDSNIIKNSKEDFESITNLLLSDEDIGGSYTFDNMLSQIIERNKEGYGRNYVIKDGNKVISHAGTGAENEKVAILSYVITDSNYRHQGLAKKLCNSVCYDLIKEGKKVYLINYTNESTALYDKLGFKICCDWGKLYKNVKKEEKYND